MQNSATITGKVYFMSQEENMGASGSTKKTVVVEYVDGNRLQRVPIDFFNPKNTLDMIGVGNDVLVMYLPTGQESRTQPGRFFSGFKGISIQILR